MNEYNFFCIICGTPLKAGRRHAKTCSTRCRALLAESMKLLPGEESPNLTEEEREILRTLQNKERLAKQNPPAPPIREEESPLVDPIPEGDKEKKNP